MDKNWWPSWRKVKDMILMTEFLKGQYIQIFGLLAALLCYMREFTGCMTLSWSNMQSERYDCDGRLRRKCSSRGPET